MRVVFAGTPAFAATALEAILSAGHEVSLVLSQPDRPAGRGLKLTPSPVSRIAADRSIALYCPVSLKSAESLEVIRSARPDVMVVAAYGLILPPSALDLPRLGCLNIHASLLPRWRGAAPVQRAILAGDLETGVGIMQMEAGLDTGPVLLQKAIPIRSDETAGSLTDRLAALGAEAVVEALANLENLKPRAQDPTLATYAAKISKAEARIDWRLAATDVDRRVRAFNPVPGAETVLAGQPLKIWESRPGDGNGPPGSILPAKPGHLRIACGSGALEVLSLQRSGARRLGPAEFLRGMPLDPGTVAGV